MEAKALLRRPPRRAALHGRHRRLRWRHPAVRVRPEPPGPARRPHPAVLVPGHDHPDHQRRRLRAARPLHGRADADNERWQDWDNRELLQGQNTMQGFDSDWQALTGAPGSTECIEGWRGSTPLAMNPTFGLAAEHGTGRRPVRPGQILAELGAGEPGYPEDFPDLGRLPAHPRGPRASGWTGRTGRTSRTSTASTRPPASPGCRGTTSASSMAPVRGPGAHHPRGVPRPQRPGRHLGRARGRRPESPAAWSRP